MAKKPYTARDLETFVRLAKKLGEGGCYLSTTHSRLMLWTPDSPHRHPETGAPSKKRGALAVLDLDCKE